MGGARDDGDERGGRRGGRDGRGGRGGRGGKGGKDDGDAREGLALSVSVRHAKVSFDDGTVARCDLAPSLFAADCAFTRPAAAGDRVRTVVDRGRRVVVGVLPRRGYLSRLRGDREQILVANLDRVVIVGAAAHPRFRPRLVDRVIVAAERARFEPVVVINKIDLAEDRAPFEAKVALYRGLGYPALLASVTTGEGVAELRALLRGVRSCAVGPSGVGKSSLLNAVEPGLGVRTAPVSDRWGKGVHTTTGTTLHPLSFGGFFADTPGVRNFAVAGLLPSEVAVFFRDFQPFIDACRFNSCTHDHEPECAVRRAVVEGGLSFERYESYLRIARGDADPPEEGDEDDDEEDGAED